MSYRRQILFENDEYQVVLFEWSQNSATPIHDHSTSRCWMQIIQGKFEEKVYDVANCKQLVSNTIYEAPQLNYMDNSIGWHQIRALGEHNITLHVYQPPLHEFRIYDPETGQITTQST